MTKDKPTGIPVREGVRCFRCSNAATHTVNGYVACKTCANKYAVQQLEEQPHNKTPAHFYEEEKPMNNYQKLNTLTTEQLQQARAQWIHKYPYSDDVNTFVFDQILKERADAEKAKEFDAFVDQLLEENPAGVKTGVPIRGK